MERQNSAGQVWWNMFHNLRQGSETRPQGTRTALETKIARLDERIVKTLSELSGLRTGPLAEIRTALKGVEARTIWFKKHIRRTEQFRRHLANNIVEAYDVRADITALSEKDETIGRILSEIQRAQEESRANSEEEKDGLLSKLQAELEMRFQAQHEKTKALLLEFRGLPNSETTDTIQSLREGGTETTGLRVTEESTSVESKLEEAETELTHYITTNKKLRDRLTFKTKEAENLDQKLEGAKGHIETLIAKCAAVGNTLSLREKTVDGLTRELGRLREQVNGFDMKLLDAKNTYDTKVRDLTDRLRAGEDGRRILFQKLQTLRGAIRVICRIRPDKSSTLLEYKTVTGAFHGDPAKLMLKDNEETLRGEVRQKWSQPYEFERIFLPGETNADIFGEIIDFVQSVFDGKKACVFCYGQSGTGKTYVMSNLEDIEDRENRPHHENDGIVPRVKTMIFEEKKRLDELGIDLSAMGCCYEIYNNELWLLKGSGRKKMTVWQAQHTIEDSQYGELGSLKAFDAMIKAGMESRHFRVTKINDTSSRSHFIISLKIIVRVKGSPDIIREGLLDLVDLAGSERTDQAGTEGWAFREGKSINMALTELGRVFVQLNNGEDPTYKGNVLTELLQRSLGRDCMTLMFVMISPLKENLSATKHTLELAKAAQSAKKPKHKKKSMGRVTGVVQLDRPVTEAQKRQSKR